MNREDTQLIFNSYLARQLLHMGNPIIDIVKHHGMENAVVFVFCKNEKFIKDYSEIQEKLSKEKYKENAKWKTKENGVSTFIQT